MRTLVVAVVAASCLLGCRPGGIGGVDAELSFSPRALVFEPTFVGAERRLTVMLENKGRAPVEVTVSVAPPFSLAASELSVWGGSSVPLQVTFRPESKGEFEGVLRIDGWEAGGWVPLKARGLAPMECDTVLPCASSVFDPQTGTCLTVPFADGMACSDTSSCVTNGHCSAGVCKGDAVTCDDSNACTTDACAAGEGCVHVEVKCAPPTNPCLAAVCDPVKGCQSVEVVDGTRCGSADCSVANICMAGECKKVAVPNGAACGDESPCQARGICQQQKCNRPAASALTEAWQYVAPQPYQLDFKGVADSAGNLYAVECNPIDAMAPPAPSQCFVNSFDAQGAVRFHTGVTFNARPVLGQGIQLIAGEAFVFSLGAGEVFAVSTADGSLLWQKSASQGISFVDPQVFGIVELAAMAATNDSVWVATTRRRQHAGSQLPMGAPPDGHAVVAVYDAHTGALKWSWGGGQAAARGIVLDAAGNSDVTAQPLGESGSSGLWLQALSPTGVPRWRQQVNGLARGVFNGRVELRSMEQLSTVTGALEWSGLWSGAFTMPNLSPLMFSKGTFEFHSNLVDDAEALTGCDALTADSLFASFRNEPLGKINWGVPVANCPAMSVSTPSLTDQGLAVIAGSLAPGVTHLRGVNTEGHEVFACELPVAKLGASTASTFSGPGTLMNGRWAVVESLGCPACAAPGPPDRLRVFQTPTLRPATRGWTAQNGSAARDNRER